MSLRRCSALAALASLVSLAAPARSFAQSEQPSPASQAEACIERGVAARVRGEDDVALTEFQRAFSLTPTARVQAQIALAEQALGRWSEAEHDLLAALEVRSDPWIARNEASLRQALTQIQTRLSSLDVRVAESGAEIFVNQRRAGVSPLARPLRVAWGTVTIEVRARGFVTQRRTIELASGSLSREEFALVRVEEAASSAVASSAAASSGARGDSSRNTSISPARTAVSWVGPTVVGAAGVATLGASIAFAVLRQGAYDACPFSAGRMGLECDTSESYARASMGPTWTTATNITLVAGGALVVGAGVWLTLNVLAARPRESASARAAPRVLPLFAAGQPVGIAVGGSL
ncbi:MAG: hypothetical protein U0269_01350 [Polyangiales bacterium]